MTGHSNYWIAIILMMIGFYGVIAKENMVKQVISLGVFQTGVFLFYISMGVVMGGTAPIWEASPEDPSLKMECLYNNPLPHVLILTAIVVGVSTQAVALAIIVNIKRAYGTIECDEIRELDLATERDESAHG